MEKLRAVIVEDEANARQTLRNMLKILCPDVEIIGEAKNADLGIELINKEKPNLVFLDIQMPGKTGFDLLKSFEEIFFDVIFTTAYQQYAVKAFRFSAIDYLLKPIDPDELVEAIKKVKEKSQGLDNQQLSVLEEHLLEPVFTKKRSPNGDRRLALSASDGIHFVALTEIIQCEAMGAYTRFHLTTGKKIIISKVLKEYEEMLDDYYFFRVHQSNIINLDHVKRYVKGDGGQVWLSDGAEIEVSRRRKEEFLALLSEFYVNK